MMKFSHLQKLIVAVICTAGVIAVLIWAYQARRGELAKEHAMERPVEVPNRVSWQGDDAVITLDAATREKSGIATLPLASSQHVGDSKAYGTVVDVAPLAELRGRLAAARAELGSRGAGINASRKQYERMKTLHAQGLVSAEALQSAEAAARSDGAAAGGASVALQSLESSARQQWGDAIGGELLAGSPRLMRWLARREILLQLTLAASAAPFNPPSAARLEMSPGRFVPLQFIAISPRSDERIQGVSYYYSVNSQGSGLQSGMSVVAWLPSGAARGGVTVPASAVVWREGKPWIYLERADGSFVRRELDAGAPVEGGFFVPGGYTEKAVVIRGAQLLLSEEFRAQIPVGEGK